MKGKILPILYLCLLSFCLQANDASKEINTFIAQAVEEKVLALMNQSSAKTKEEVINLLGIPDHTTKKKISYIRNKYKFAIHITFDEEKISKIEYKITGKEARKLKDIAAFIDKEKVEVFPRADSHTRAKYLVYPFKDFLLYFHNNSNQTLTKIVYEK